MAGEGYSRLGKARRRGIKKQKKDQMWENIISDIGAVGVFAAGQIKKSKTAWGEYEAGYESLGGDLDALEKPGFFESLKKPEGEIKIGNRMYDRGDISKLGGFIGSDSGAFIRAQEGGIFDRYKELIAPGRFQTEEDLKKETAEIKESAYADIVKRFNLNPSKVSSEGVSNKQPVRSSIDPTGLKGRKTLYDEYGAFEGTREWESGDIARSKGEQFHKKDIYGYSDWDRLLIKKNYK